MAKITLANTNKLASSGAARAAAAEQQASAENRASPQVIAKRLQSLRTLMEQRDYAALLVPRADEFLGEYIPPDKERLHWLTDFTGSAGMAVVLSDRAGLFVDGRYTVQVRQQVPGDCFSFHHLIDEPPLQWLAQQLDGGRVACDPRLHSMQWWRGAQRVIRDAGLTLVADENNLIDACWHDQPAPLVQQIQLHAETFSGESAVAKRRRIAAAIRTARCDAALVFPPDCVSWLLNIRGTQMPQLPVVQASALLAADTEVTLFIEHAPFSEQDATRFAVHVGEGVRIETPSAQATALAHYCDKRVLVDSGTASAQWVLALEDAGVTVVDASDPVLLPKACKNPVELAGTRDAHRRDGAALVRFLAWLDAEVAAGRLHNEAELAQQLFAFRSQGEYFTALSFDTISAAGANAALCHYNHLNGEPATLPMNSIYLVDSGGQYFDGTTDITRSVAIGDPGVEVRRFFTLVLKGHIALATARFPTGTTGTQLDALARQFLWREGCDYDHGTGHGVGAYLSVHEGPQRIAKLGGDVPLQEGMIVSNEPGYYRDGAFGLRCENLLAVCAIEQADSEMPLLAFETLSLAPFDTRLLVPELLSEVELDWLNTYHQRVREALQPLLNGADNDWLASATRPVA